MSNHHALLQYQLVEKALHFIHQQQRQQPSLAAIAEHCAMSETHFQKVFTRWAGVSPKRFLQYLTREQCLQRLVTGQSLLDCSHSVGLSGSSRLHDLFIKLDAVTPGEIKLRGEGLQFYCGIHETVFGFCFIACTERGVHQLSFTPTPDSEPYINQLQQQWPKARFSLQPKHTRSVAERLDPGPGSDAQRHQPLTLWLRGTPFQFKVWEALLSVPEGQLCTYSDLASVIRKPGAARAVGSAVGSNPVAWLIPCHRVIRKIGATGDYRWGEIRKQAILGWEAHRAGPEDNACEGRLQADLAQG